MRPGVVVGVALALVVSAAAATGPTDRDVDAVASQLRCVVCQSLSVADSPSDMARQMRDLVRERLAAGQSPDEVKKYFVERYGEWVLLSPPARGFGLLAWTVPLAALGGGVLLALVKVRRWSRTAAGTIAALDEAIDDDALRSVRAEIEGRTR